MNQTLLRVTLGILGMSAALACAASRTDGFDPANATIEDLRAALDSNRVTSEQLVRYYTDRIERLDKRGPRINALITLNPNALREARRLDAASNGRPRAPLYGIPFIVKDNYDTAGIATSGGSAALAHSIPSTDAFVVRRLLDQGAILIGKANMSELAASYGRLSYSSVGGLTLNPYDTARNASGSSSGSAAAVAADFAPFALGTDTSGSIRGPASVTGLVGLHPTLGLVSRNGIIPASLTFDTPGALTRTVEDQAIVLDALAGPDQADAATLRQPADIGRYRDALRQSRSDLRGAKLGIVGNFRGGNPEVDGVDNSAADRLWSLGAVLVPVTLPEEFERLWNAVLDPVSEAEFKPQFERYLRALPPGQPKTLAELIGISASPGMASSATPINPARLAALRQADTTQLTDSAAHIRILTDVIPALRLALENLMSSRGLDALAFATMSCPASPRFDLPDPTYVCRSEDPYRASYVAAAVGFPEISVPAARISHDLPVGYSFLGTPFTERRLLALAAAFQNARPRFPPPRMTPGQTGESR
jgi:amidase